MRILVGLFTVLVLASGCGGKEVCVVEPVEKPLRERVSDEAMQSARWACIYRGLDSYSVEFENCVEDELLLAGELD